MKEEPLVYVTSSRSNTPSEKKQKKVCCEEPNSNDPTDSAINVYLFVPEDGYVKATNPRRAGGSKTRLRPRRCVDRSPGHLGYASDNEDVRRGARNEVVSSVAFRRPSRCTSVYSRRKAAGARPRHSRSLKQVEVKCQRRNKSRSTDPNKRRSRS